ncbi:unnamed protein product [Adineta ricciae]|uniref:Uncharacterized protein n=1 Tax=Adineta ricciae TaxID=249248 RepID=A0A814EGV0_ADIRI|nr:unnamed protein product [Adineta ricciae]
MRRIFNTNESIRLRQEILSQCIWSDSYSSLKHILKRTAHRLPLLISFLDPHAEQNLDERQPTKDNYRTIFFFDRNVSNKLLLTPLRQSEHQPDQFDVYPEHCTFAITDLFKGLFEFIQNGQRTAKVFLNLEQLIAFITINVQSSIVFISRDRVVGYFQDSPQWSSKEYPQGSVFRGERIHRSSVLTGDGHRIPNDYLECHDEDGYTVFLKTDQNGRFSLISTSSEQQQSPPEMYVHSTLTPNIGQLIKHITGHNDNGNHNNCIRLVRGSVPQNFLCQYFQLVRQHSHDVLVGLTQEGLVIEWNLDSHVSCRYATNLDDILDTIDGSTLTQTLETYIDQARTHYRENFQLNMQLVSTVDWAAFFQYWKSIGKLRRKYNDSKPIPYQSRHRFHLVGSLDDLSDHPRTLAAAFRKYHSLLLTDENSTVQNKKPLSRKQSSLLSQMTKLFPVPLNSKRQHSDRSSHRNPLANALLFSTGEQPFDDSIYDSNHILPTSSKDHLIQSNRRKTKRI